MESIQERNYNAVVMQAALRGVKMEPYKKVEKVTKEDEARANKMRDEIIREKLNGR